MNLHVFSSISTKGDSFYNPVCFREQQKPSKGFYLKGNYLLLDEHSSCFPLSLHIYPKMFYIYIGNIEEVRVLYYHVVMCGYMQVTSFLIPIISVWPEVLRREDGKISICCITIQ